MNEQALTIDGLSVARGGRTVVDDVSLTVPSGEITALLGPNGAGKSSLVLALGGLLPVAAGRVLVGDDEVTGWRPDKVRQAGLAIVPEGRRLLPDLTVAENLKVACYHLSSEETASHIDYATELFPELTKRWDTNCRLLSGGEQQMVVLAQAIVRRPTVLVVDELSLGLAPLIVSRLVPTLAEVAASGTSVLLIEQFAHVALGLATGAHVLEGGRLAYSGTAAELTERPELLQRAYLLTGDDSSPS